MIEYLRDLLNDLKLNHANILNQKQKTIALETAIEIMEKMRNEERSSKK